MSDFAAEMARGTGELRTLAEDLMVDACTIERPSGVSITDPVSGVVTISDAAPVYEGKCRVQVAAQAEEQDDSGERRYMLLNAIVSVPVDATEYRQGDLVVITASAFDPALVGKRYRVRVAVAKSHLTARRLHCEEGI